jgi:ribosomal-protein-alanine N-acetyltransferase
MAHREAHPSRLVAGTGDRASHRVTVRLMTESDLPVVLDIERAAFSNPWTADMFLAEIRENPFAQFWVAIIDDEIVGYLGGWVIVDELHLLNLAVRADQRRRGLAKRLLSQAFHRATHAITKASLEVRRSNHAAIGVYEGFGFRPVGVRKGYYTDPSEDAVVMECVV